VQFLGLLVGGLVTWRITNCELRISESANQRIACNPQPKSRITHHASRFSFLFFWLTLGLTLFPWLARNRVVFGRWMLSTAFEENLARVSAVATLAEIEGVRVEPWTETWEYYYDRLVANADATASRDTRTLQYDPCAEQRQRQTEVARAARDIVSAHPFSYLRAHLRGVLTSLRDPGHRLWYHVLAGKEWESTGVVADIGARMAWALERGALGDALHALWTERIARPPLLAALLWWGLCAARVTVWWMCGRGVWRLRHKPWLLLTLAGSVAYILLLPGPIAYDRFYLPAIPLVVVLIAAGSCGGAVKGPECPRRLD
jgi:hypothetical protein